MGLRIYIKKSLLINVNQVKVGDIVLLKNIQPDMIKKRQHWCLARILELVPGFDGNIRSVKLLKASADYETRPRQPELHPINHLFPLELSITHNHIIPPQDDIDIAQAEVEPEFDFSGFEEDLVEDREDHDDPTDPVSATPTNTLEGEGESE
ncbi:unnamed protein product [Meganyctiphanes norvegica]|uniref:DUF5641 domain-containing protein n=1 Tax=Meganyctiphanes norvegica TaxID=48144 RepID=A0AAV2RXL7_MEGNR